MKISDYLIISKKTITAYNKTCESVLKKYDIPQVSFDILMFLTNNPEYVTAQDISEIKGIKKNLVSVPVLKSSDVNPFPRKKSCTIAVVLFNSAYASRMSLL